mmetsp:Transcript_16702/g.28313  ORF Transcript_16702/g.28313 Transcript_16702/m.28313 type:complete len:201 (-) Transcript_16702:2365-2967(-)
MNTIERRGFLSCIFINSFNCCYCCRRSCSRIFEIVAIQGFLCCDFSITRSSVCCCLYTLPANLGSRSGSRNFDRFIHTGWLLFFYNLLLLRGRSGAISVVIEIFVIRIINFLVCGLWSSSDCRRNLISLSIFLHGILFKILSVAITPIFLLLTTTSSSNASSSIIIIITVNITSSRSNRTWTTFCIVEIFESGTYFCIQI